MMIKPEDALMLIDWWIENQDHLREWPKEMNNFMSKEIVNWLQKPYRDPGGKITLDALRRMREDSWNRLNQQKTQTFNRNNIYLQCLVVIMMVVAGLISYWGYEAQIALIDDARELNAPQFEANIECPPLADENMTLSIDFKVANYGKIGTLVWGNASTKGVVSQYVGGAGEISGMDQYSTDIVFTPRFLEGGNVWAGGINLLLENVTQNFSITFNYNCKNPNEKYRCSFLTNNVHCDYRYNGSQFIYQNPCYACMIK